MPYRKRPDLKKKREGSTKKKTWVRGHYRGLPIKGQEIGIVGFILFLIALFYAPSWIQYQFTTYPLISRITLSVVTFTIGGIIWILIKTKNKDK